MKHDYTQYVIRTDKGFKLKNKSHLLLSPTRLLKPISEYGMFPIPEQVLERRRDYGANVSHHLKTMWETKTDPSQMLIPHEYQQALISILKGLTSNEYKIVDVEKFFCNSTICGFVDLIIKDKQGKHFVIEIKTRTKKEVRKTDLFQAKVYSLFFGVPAMVLMIDEKHEIKTIPVSGLIGMEQVDAVLCYLKAFGVSIHFQNDLKE